MTKESGFEIGFIGGGQMGEALVKGLLKAGLYKASSLLVAEPNAARRGYLETTYGIATRDTVLPVWQACGTVLLAVKPQVMTEVLTTAKPSVQKTHLIITIAAGLPLAVYEQILDKGMKIIRVMPNTPALVLEGASALCCNSNVTTEEMRMATAIFNAVGKAVVLDERYLDAVTGLSGSGPAYVFTFIEALIDAGLKTGLARDVAEILAMQTVLGSMKLMRETKEHPAVLRSRVTSPGGTTIAGLHVLEKNGFRGIIMDAVEAATNRSAELGRQ
jgi:pyrroline-5-carboxylate reductase